MVQKLLQEAPGMDGALCFFFQVPAPKWARSTLPATAKAP